MPGLRIVLAAAVMVAAPAAAKERFPQPPGEASAVLAPDAIDALVAELAQLAEQRYVDREGGEKIARHLRANSAQGQYAPITNPVRLAARLSADMYAAVPDLHLRVAYEPNRAAETMNGGMIRRAGGGPQPVARIDARSTGAIARSNFGFDAVERLDGNVGYLKLSRFVPLDLSAPTATAAMQFLSSTDALVIDLRGNIGGSPDLVNFLVSHFLGPDPVNLMTRYIRDEDREETLASLRELPGGRRTGSPLFVLVDGNSASSAEMLAYFVQRQGIGTVIGQTSSGAGQGGTMFPLGSGLLAFMPITRIIDGPGWEDTGITPDIETQPAAARDTAHRAALRALIERGGDDQARREREWALEILSPSVPASDGRQLARFEGQFGARRFDSRDGALVVTGPRNRIEKLAQVGANVFRGSSQRYTFAGEGLGLAGAVKVETAEGTEVTIARDWPR